MDERIIGHDLLAQFVENAHVCSLRDLLEKDLLRRIEQDGIGLVTAYERFRSDLLMQDPGAYHDPKFQADLEEAYKLVRVDYGDTVCEADTPQETAIMKRAQTPTGPQ